MTKINEEIGNALVFYVENISKNKNLDYFFNHKEGWQSIVETILLLNDEELLSPVVDKIPQSPAEQEKYKVPLTNLIFECAKHGFGRTMREILEKYPKLILEVVSVPPEKYNKVLFYDRIMPTVLRLVKEHPEILQSKDENGNNVCHRAAEIGGFYAMYELAKNDTRLVFEKNNHGKTALDYVRASWGEKDVKDIIEGLPKSGEKFKAD